MEDQIVASELLTIDEEALASEILEELKEEDKKLSEILE